MGLDAIRRWWWPVFFGSACVVAGGAFLAMRGCDDAGPRPHPAKAPANRSTANYTVEIGAGVASSTEARSAATDVHDFCASRSPVWSTVTKMEVSRTDVSSGDPDLAGDFFLVGVSFNDERRDLHNGNTLWFRLRPDRSAIVALKSVSATLCGLGAPDRAYPLR